MSNREKVLFCNRKNNKKTISLHFKKRKYRSNYNIRRIIDKRSPLYRTIAYHQDISRYLFLKLYGIPTIRRYNYKKRSIGDLIRQYRLKYNPKYCRKH